MDYPKTGHDRQEWSRLRDKRYMPQTNLEGLRCETKFIYIQSEAKRLFLGCVTRFWGRGQVTQPRKSLLADLCITAFLMFSLQE